MSCVCDSWPRGPFVCDSAASRVCYASVPVKIGSCVCGSRPLGPCLCDSHGAALCVRHVCVAVGHGFEDERDRVLSLLIECRVLSFRWIARLC